MRNLGLLLVLILSSGCHFMSQHTGGDWPCGGGRDEYLCPSTYEPPLTEPDTQMFVVTSIIGVGGGPSPKATRKVNRAIQKGKEALEEARRFAAAASEAAASEAAALVTRLTEDLAVAEEERLTSATILSGQKFFAEGSEDFVKYSRELGRLGAEELERRANGLGATLLEVRRYLERTGGETPNPNPFIPPDCIESARQAAAKLEQLVEQVQTIARNRTAGLN